MRAGLGVPDHPAPKYDFIGPTLSEDRKTVSVGVGGVRTYATAKFFEDEIPKDLWQYFPPEFLNRLEYECAGRWYTMADFRKRQLEEMVRYGRLAEQQLGAVPGKCTK